jgi:hypothetical protein
MVGGSLRVLRLLPPLSSLNAKFRGWGLGGSRQVNGFLRVLWFPSPIKRTAMI